MELSCKVNYTGNREPVLEWRNSNESQVTQMISLHGREVRSTVIVDRLVKNCGFVCEIDTRNRESDESLLCFPTKGDHRY